MVDRTTSQTSPDRAGRRNQSKVLVIIVAVFAIAALIYAFAGSLRPKLKVGDTAPTFKVTTRNGLQIDSAMLRGSPVVINFFASWCKPCQEEAADLEAIWQDYRDQGVIFLGITYEDTEKNIVAFIEQHGLSFHIADDRDGIARKFGVTGVPETYVIGRQGTLLHKKLGAIDPATVRATLDSALSR